MTEMILGLYPQPEDPPETVVVFQGNRQKVVPTEDLWAYSADAMHQTPQDTNESEGEQ